MTNQQRYISILESMLQSVKIDAPYQHSIGVGCDNRVADHVAAVLKRVREQARLAVEESAKFKTTKPPKQ